MPKLSLGLFGPPGPGQWTVDPAHHTRPVSALYYEVGFPGHARGHRAGALRYGSLLEGPRFARVERFVYGQPNLVAVRPPGDEATARVAFDAQVEADPDLQSRFATADEVLRTSRWEIDLEQWDEFGKPYLMRQTRSLASVDTAGMSLPELSGHFEECAAHFKIAGFFHHLLNLVAVVPLGEFELRAGEWTGLEPDELAGLLRGHSPASAGWEAEMEALAAALQDNGTAAALLDGGDDTASDRLSSLIGWDGEVGRAMVALVATAGYRTVAGFDPMDLFALELPSAFLARIKAAMFGPPPKASPENIDAVREQVPADARQEFDRLLRRAQRFARLKDERGLYANFPAGGLLRRAVLEIGQRAEEQGIIEDPSHATEATLTELRQFLSGAAALPGGDLARRHEYRLGHTIDDVPGTLGEPHEFPVPPEWLPEPASYFARLQAARARLMRGVAPAAESSPTKGVLSGTPAGTGSYTGRACVVVGPADFARVQEGDVIVAKSTNPGYSVILGLARAIVAETGGPYSHAAIVAREFGIPGIVACPNITALVRDGQTITVDAESGCVRLG